MCEIHRSGRRDVQERDILGRTPEWTDQSLEYEAGDKHQHALLRGLGLSDDSKTVNSVGMKQEELSQDEDEEILGAEEALRSLAATSNNKKLDGSGVQYAEEHVCSKVANLTQRSWKGPKNAGRYLKGIQRVIWVMQAWENVDVVRGDVHVDSDCAKCPERKSTSGGMMMLNETVVKHKLRPSGSQD